jgi:hypothetical protein
VKNILFLLSLFVVAIITTNSNIDKSYSQNFEAVEKLSELYNTCATEYYLVNQTNVKIINIFLTDTSTNVCVNDINQLLEKDFTIKGTLLDRYIILEKIK